MLKTQLFPTRTTVGRPIPIASVRILDRSSAVRDQVPIFTTVRQQRAEMVDEPMYSQLLPERIQFAFGSASPSEGMATLPIPRDLPFAEEASYAALFGIGGPVQNEISRNFWVDIEINFTPSGRGPFGGLCYGGYPFLPYYVTSQGLNSANFGLPRELRLNWRAGATGFLDADAFETRQSLVSHSGVHVFATGPIETDRVVLRISDFPRLIQESDRITDGLVKVRERWGFALPFLYAFEHREATRYRPRVPAGLLAATQTPPNHRQSVIPTDDPQQQEELAGVAADYHFRAIGGPEPVFFANTGASLMGQHRDFVVGQGTQFRESFGSGLLREGHRVTIVVEQTEEHPRCIAGIRATYPIWLQNSGVPPTVLTVEVFEVDPLDGVSPIRAVPDLAGDRYSERLCHLQNVRTGSGDLTCSFIRPSSARYFAVVLTCASDEGRIFLHQLELVQSAHVAVTTRRSRTQHFGALNFRLVGPGLGDDYSRIGVQGFSLAVEHLVAGQRRSVLFAAKSLLELASLPGAQVHQNHRFVDTLVEVADEQVITQKGSYDHLVNGVRAYGWRRSETGEGVFWPENPNATLDENPPELRDAGFAAFGNAEARQHTELLPVQGRADETQLLFGPLVWALTGTPLEFKFPSNTRLSEGTHRQVSWGDRIWKGTDIFGADINGLVNVSIPPWMLLPEVFEKIGNILAHPEAAVQDDLFQIFSSLSPFSFVNGVTVGLSGSISVVGGSISTGSLLPSVTRNLSSGSTASIAKQANSTGYSYGQHLNQSFDESTVMSVHEGGEMNRRTTRTVDRDASDRPRVAGHEVYWYGKPVDIVTGTIPLQLSFPAGAGPGSRTSDEAVRVRLDGGVPDSISLDVWFDVVEEVLRDDY